MLKLGESSQEPPPPQLLSCWAAVGHHLKKSSKLHEHFNKHGKKGPGRDVAWQVFEVLYMIVHTSQNSSINPSSCFPDLASCLGRCFWWPFVPFKALGQFIFNIAQSRGTGGWEKGYPGIQWPLPFPPLGSACHTVVASPFGNLLFSGQISAHGPQSWGTHA